MAEMAQTAEHLMVIGRGRLIADTTVADIVAQARTGAAVLVRTPQAAACATRSVRDGVSVTSSEPELLEVHGMTSAEVGAVAARHGVVLHELIPQTASLEQAFMRPDRRGRRVSRRAVRRSRTPSPSRRPHERARITRHPDDPDAGPLAPPAGSRSQRPRVGVDEAVDAALDAVVAAGRRSSRWPGLGPLIAAVQMSRWSTAGPPGSAHLRRDQHRRRRLPPGPAGDRRPRRAGDHRRVLAPG